MSLIINGMSLPKHSAVNGEKDTADWDSNDFGKQVFLTKEQAEQTLKERESK